MAEQEHLSFLHSGLRDWAARSDSGRSPWFPRVGSNFWVSIFWSSFPPWSLPNMPRQIEQSSIHLTQLASSSICWRVAVWSCVLYPPIAWCTRIFPCCFSRLYSPLGLPDNYWWSGPVDPLLSQFSHSAGSCWCFQKGWWWSCSGSLWSRSSKRDVEACSLHLVCLARMWYSAIQWDCSPKEQLDLSRTPEVAWQSRAYSKLWPDGELTVQACSLYPGSAAPSSRALDDTECECTCSSSWKCCSLSPRSAPESASTSSADTDYLHIT